MEATTTNAVVNEYNYEVYTKNPVDGTGGWDIKFISVFAPSREEARMYLNQWELFDEIILFNFKVEGNDERPKGSIVDSTGYHHYKLAETLFTAKV